MIVLLGGARSGKSATAVRLASRSKLAVTVIATAQAGDDEMAARIARHRGERPAGWTTIEAPLHVAEAVAATDASHFVILDCLTLWVSNLLGAGAMADEVCAQARAVTELLRSRQSVVVSNEVGLGIVPANALARRYRDALGEVNATFAAAASRTLLMVAGRALELSAVEALST